MRLRSTAADQAGRRPVESPELSFLFLSHRRHDSSRHAIFNVLLALPIMAKEKPVESFGLSVLPPPDGGTTAASKLRSYEGIWCLCKARGQR